MVTNDMTRSPVGVDNSNGRGCVLVGNEDQSTQAQFAINNNAKNNVIENCNSSSSSSYHHPPANQNNNNNNETSIISSSSSSSDDYFSATDNSLELQCHQFDNTNCTNRYSITSSSYKYKRSIQQDTGCHGTTARNAKKNKTNENNSARVRCLIFQFIFTNVLSISHCHFALFSRYFYKE